jgi:hypothetical protein
MPMRILVLPALVAALALAGASPLKAQPAMPAPGGGPTFGHHVAHMAPEHATEHGAMFGACVSAMARGGDCPHAP